MRRIYYCSKLVGEREGGIESRVYRAAGRRKKVMRQAKIRHDNPMPRYLINATLQQGLGGKVDQKLIGEEEEKDEFCAKR